MILGVINRPAEEHFTVVDSDSNLISGIDGTAFTVYVYNPAGVDVTASVNGSFTELGNGSYKYIFTPNVSGVWYNVVTHPTYFPWGKTDDIVVHNADLTDIYDAVKKTIGLVHENFYIDESVYDEFGNMVSGRVRIYSDSASVGTNNNVIDTYRIEASATACGQFTFWKQVVSP